MKTAILMYHYVRDFSRPGTPPLKGLDAAAFARQLDLVGSVCNFVTMEQVVEAWNGGARLPERAALLTFDDGYSDHYHFAYRAMRERGISGAFYPVASTILEGRVLDINKIHFLLAMNPDPRPLIDRMRAFIDAEGEALDTRPFGELWQELAKDGRFDPGEIMFIKGCLQHALPPEARRILLDDLFTRHSGFTEAELAADLYLSREMMKEMQAAGMHFGNHSTNHRWLSYLDSDELAAEIDGGLEMLAATGMRTENWTMCYPFEGPTAEAEERILSCVRSRGCAAGLTVVTETADTARHDRFLLPRFDTTDIPADSNGVTALFGDGGATGH